METNIVETSRSSVLKWFTGKAYSNADHALKLLALSEREGAWLPKHSRYVTANLSKANVARAIAIQNERELEKIGGEYKTPRAQRGWEVAFALRYGCFDRRGAGLDWAAIHDGASTPQLKAVVDRALEFVQAFEPINALIAQLDATRPKPTVTYLGASPTVTKLLEGLGLAVAISTVRVCPIEWELVEGKNKEGKTIRHWVGRMLWPTGTVHGASRYNFTEHNEQCQACGHAIKNAGNWVPLIMENQDGKPHSLWVGTDCARRLFGIKIAGKFELHEGERK